AQTVSGIPNSDLIITLTGSDADGDVLSYHVVWPPSFGTLYQFSTGTRGACVTNADTIVTDPKGRLVFAPDPDVTGKPYSQFDFIADDGVSKSSSQTVIINILTQP